MLSKVHPAGGEGGIRTPGGLAPPTVFKTVAIDHSATSPGAHIAKPSNSWAQAFNQAKNPPDMPSPGGAFWPLSCDVHPFTGGIKSGLSNSALSGSKIC